MSLKDSMEAQAKIKQIQNTKLVFSKFYPFNNIREHGIQTKALNLSLVLKPLRLNESKLSSSCIGINYLKMCINSNNFITHFLQALLRYIMRSFII